MQGVVTEFRFVNPHPFLIIDVQHEPWKLEMDNLSELVDVGMTKETFKAGDRVVVEIPPLAFTDPKRSRKSHIEPASCYLETDIAHAASLHRTHFRIAAVQLSTTLIGGDGFSGGPVMRNRCPFGR